MTVSSMVPRSMVVSAADLDVVRQHDDAADLRNLEPALGLAHEAEAVRADDGA